MKSIKGYDKVKNKLQNIQKANKFRVKKELVLYASTLIDGIIDRTQKGKSFKGSSFPSYSKKYLEYKKTAKKRISKSFMPDLTLNFHMLGNINKKTRASGIMLYFPDATERKKADRHHNGIGVKKREFFALDKNQKRNIKTKIERIYKRATK